jgi:transcription elongation factor GreA
MDTQKEYLSQEKLEQLKLELIRLKTVDRKEVAERLDYAKSLGDLSENAEYHAAREKQGFIEGRIAELEGKLSRAEVIDTSKLSGETVMFGATVSLLDEDTDAILRYQIVGADESDIASGLLSIASPLARSIVGKRVKESVVVKTPRGEKNYEILAINFI